MDMTFVALSSYLHGIGFKAGLADKLATAIIRAGETSGEHLRYEVSGALTSVFRAGANGKERLVCQVEHRPAQL